MCQSDPPLRPGNRECSFAWKMTGYVKVSDWNVRRLLFFSFAQKLRLLCFPHASSSISKTIASIDFSTEIKAIALSVFPIIFH